MSTFVDADRIFVFDAGRIAEVGTYDDLVAQDGIFAELARCSELGSPTDCNETRREPSAAAN